MANRKLEAWITSALSDEDADNALVLAESLRRTESSRIIGIVYSQRISSEKREIIQKVFDGAFLIDENKKIRDLALYANLFPLSIPFLGKAVFVANTSVFLENVDDLFEDRISYKFITKDDGSLDLSFYVCQPNKSLMEYMMGFGSSLTVMDIQQWLKSANQFAKVGTIEEDVFAKLSVGNGVITKNKPHGRIVQMIDIPKGLSLGNQMQSLKKLPFNSDIIVKTWLSIDSSVRNTLKNLENIPGPMTRWAEQKYRNEPIAIVGMSCRYPAANNLDEFWNLLYAGEEAAREPPAFRWTKEHSVRYSQQARKTQAGFISTPVDKFDARFFGVSPKEAAYMDPQSRLLHEVVWESLEDSGIDPLSLYGSHTGIFTGSWLNDYSEIVRNSAETEFFRTYMGNSMGATAARLSFLLGLTGPSIATESGCSSAVVALDLAVKSLRNGEINLAVTGGVNLILHPFTSNMIEQVISPDGRCKTFDANADGFGRAEGCGVLVLKRMSDALRDRDNIWALIRGSAVSQEGLSRSMGTPTVHCEALAMQLALEDANVTPSQISFVETHGTGTAVGDPMEVSAITKAYCSPERKTPLVIGSVKTNVGHTESCSGITGIMKTVLALQHEIIPKHRNLTTLNPEIFLEGIPAVIPMENMPWPKVAGQPRIAGVSSFGITGTDGHVIVEEAPDYTLPKFDSKLERPLHLIKICGKSSQALDEMLTLYENNFSQHVSAEGKAKNILADTAFTANVGRASFNHRAFIVAPDIPQAIESFKSGSFFRGEVKDGDNRQICFLFTGQGSQYKGMGKILYETNPVFRVHFDSCDRILRQSYNLSIREVLWESEGSEISRTIYSQTSIFCIEYCLLKLWESWGILPDFVLGHSLGEFAAAVAAGILEFEDALKLVAERSKLIDCLPRGSMLVIKANKKEVEKLLDEGKADLDFAAVNNPDQTVVAGDTPIITDFLAFLKKKGVKAIILDATHAFHSRHMDPMLESYRKVASSIDFKAGHSNVQYVSGMDGRLVDSSEINADYWVRHTREKVSFVEACAALNDCGCSEYLEIGPQPVLSSFVMMNNDSGPMTCFPSMRRGIDEWQTILESLGKLFLLGYKVDWKGFDKPYIRNKVSIPFHPFHGKSYWVEVTNGAPSILHPLVGHRLKNASDIHIFQNDLTLKAESYIKDHRIGERVVFPGAGYIEMVLTAGYCVANGLSETLELPARPIQIKDVRIEAPLEMKEDKSCRFQTLVELPKTNNDDVTGFQVKVFHQSSSEDEEDKWWLHSTAKFVPAVSTKQVLSLWQPQRVKQVLSHGENIAPPDFYKTAADNGLKFGSTFQMARTILALKNTEENIVVDDIVLEMKLPETFTKYLLHPLCVDAIFQAGILTGYRSGRDQRLHVPIRTEQITMLSRIAPESESVLCHAWYNNGLYHGVICTPDLVPIALFEDVELLETNVRTIESVLEQQSSSTADSWEEVWKTIPSPFSTAANIACLQDLYTDKAKMEEIRGLETTPEPLVRLFGHYQQLISSYILNTLYDLGWKPTPGANVEVSSFCAEHAILPQFEKLVRFYFTLFEKDGILLKQTSSWKVFSTPPDHYEVRATISTLEDILRNSSSNKYFAVIEEVAKNLGGILKGTESSLSLLFPTDPSKQYISADAFYQNHPGREITLEAVQVSMRGVFSSSHSNSGSDKIFRVLEVGSGTGSLSLKICQELKNCWGERFELYFTDISTAFFIKTEKKLEEFKDNIKYALFNVEESPLPQGIPLNYFDCVMATDVIHATRDLQESLTHLRQTLKPDGVLLFTETVSESREITFVFGLLDGYWRYEDYDWRPHHACVGADIWTELMQRTGFHETSSCKVYNNELALIMGAADQRFQVVSLPEKVRATEECKRKWIIFSTNAWFVETTSLANALKHCGYSPTVVLDKKSRNLSIPGISCQVIENNEDPTEFMRLFGMQNFEDSCKAYGVIYAWGVGDTCHDQSELALPLLNIFKCVADQKKPPQIFVLTKGLRSVKEDAMLENPSSATLLGMAKALKNENWDVFTRCIDLDSAPGYNPDTAVSQVLYEMAMTTGKELHRAQVAYRDSTRYEPKFCRSSVVDDPLSLPPSTDRYHLTLPKTRAIKDLSFDSAEEKDIGHDQVEVKVVAYALNFRDIFAILKPSKEFESINGVGIDYSGEVIKVGKSVTKFSPGDRVFGANFGDDDQLSSHVVADTRLLFKVPQRMTLWEAATIPAVYSTALYSFMETTQVGQNDTVLIHTGSGGVGLAAIQLCKHFGAKIITTAGNSRKRAYLRSLGLEHVFHSRNLSYEEDIRRVTNGRGVDVVLNSITGPGFKEATLRSCAKGARFIEMSKLSVWAPEEVKSLRPDVQYTIIDVTKLDIGEVERLNTRYEDLIEREVIQPLPYAKFDALDVRHAMQFFQKAKHIGKVILVMPEIKTEKGEYKVVGSLFNNNSTYWITGGLGGGIGFEVCKWMLTVGATDIILSGRTPPKPEVANAITRMNSDGFNVKVELGDIGNYSQCQSILERIDNSKPLRGVMHCAGVLRDNLYRNQTWEDFEATFTPKVTGTWNLHNLTRNMPLEHFVVFSSITALMGTPSQPNHAAANCFEDAFIHYRQSLGLTGTTINWGQWAQVGVAKEISMTGIRPVSLKRMMSGLEETLRTQKRQICYCDFDSFKTVSILIPMVPNYVDERLLNQENTNESAPAHGLNADVFWKEMDVETKEEKVDVMSKYLKIILRTTLRLGATETIGDHTNIQDLGVDSLMMIELKNSIQTLLGARLILTAASIKNCNTVHLLSTAIITKLLDEEVDAELDEPLDEASLQALLIEDSALHDGIIAKGPPTRISEVKVVLVTGSTGRLAPYIIIQLINNYPSVERIICLVRNAKDPIAAKEKVKTNLKYYGLNLASQKVECIVGNVAKDHFGVSNETWKDLASNCDAIIHCAATSDNSESYRKSNKSNNARSVNVEGTRNVIQFAAESKTKHIFFASNIINGIIRPSEGARLPDAWPDDETVDDIIEYKVPGLQTCKLVCELLLRQAVERGIPCKVFRLPWIAGDSQTGCLNPIDNLYILRYISYLKLKAMPSLALPATPIPADILAALTLQLFFNEDSPNEVFNITHPSPSIEQEFVAVAKEEFGVDLEILEQGDFLDKIRNEIENSRGSASSGKMNVELELFFKFISDIAYFTKGFITSPETFFKNEKLSKYLPCYYKAIPPAIDVIRRDIKYLKATGLLQQFEL